MDINQIRRDNLRALADRAGGRPALAERLNIAYAQLNHYIGKTPVRNIGPNMARKAEKSFSLPLGWMDFLHEESDSNGFIAVGDAGIIEGEPDQSFVMVPQFDVHAACGVGYINDSELLKGGLMFRRSWIEQLGLSTAQDSLCVAYAHDLSMWPTIDHGAVVLIDKSDTDSKKLQNGKIYAFCYGNGFRIKRVFINAVNSIRLASDNPNKHEYPDEILNPADFEHIQIVGRVRWRGGEL